MGRRGPPRKPDELKAAQGNPSEHSLNDRLPEYDTADIVSPPSDLGEHGRALWVQQSGMLIQHSVLRKPDLPILYTYCKTFDDLKHWQNVLAGFQKKKKLDFYDMRAMGMAQRQVVQLRTSFKHYAQELGLSPASRSGVQGKRKTSGQKAADKGQGQTGGTAASRFFGNQSGGGLRGLPGGKTGTET